ncbi:hypothetical protein BGZ63DRAFT_419767 [Mariannaea sp. PMI_226]|nr:hypothetical protein BGZ63DRAFT_419767 [Mariannaea sp. PMI_226]
MLDLASLVKPRKGLLFSKSSREQLDSPVTIDWKIESSPTIILGNEDNLPSFLSGQVLLKLNEDNVEVERFFGSLSIHTVQKKPFKNRCADCKDQHDVLQSWSFLDQEAVFEKGSHQFAFSALIPDDLPATMDTPLLSVSYEFKCEVRFRQKNTGAPQSSNFTREIAITRSSSLPDGPVYSDRFFQSAGIGASSSIESILHQEKGSRATISLKGLRRSTSDDENIEMWRIWKGAWQLEERIKTVVKPCKRHEVVPPDGNGDVVREKTRLLGERSLYEGWTTNDAAGTAQLDFEFGIKRYSSSSLPTYSYDTKSLDGTEVSHQLTVELVLIKENLLDGRPELAARTGAGRILRLHYRVAMVDDSVAGPGCIIENLPSYNDIWPSPPTYFEDGFIPGPENAIALEV